MNRSASDQILLPKPEARPRIYAYSIDDKHHNGLLKIGQTAREVKQRVAEQLKTAAIKNYRIELDESAERNDGSVITDREVRAALAKKGCKNGDGEWMRCKAEDIRTRGRDDLQQGVQLLAQDVMDAYGAGIIITGEIDTWPVKQRIDEAA